MGEGNLGMQQRMFWFSFRKMPEGTFARDEDPNGVNSVFFQACRQCSVVTKLCKLSAAQFYDVLFTPIVMVGW